jgi:UDP-glucose 4-epimerase
MFEGVAVLVTGGAGFIGSHLVDRLVAQGAIVTIVDNLTTGFRQFINPKAVFLEGDLLDISFLERAMQGQQFVFHLAANADIKEGLNHPRRDIEQNTIATQNVLEAMRSANVRRIMFSSTGSVYGEPKVFPTPEQAPFPIQTSLYATSKVAAEGLLSAYALGYGFETFVFRFVSILGPRYSHGHIYDFWRQLQTNASELRILGDGKQLKSYCHVEDCVNGIFAGIEHGRRVDGVHVFNIGRPDMLELNRSIQYICHAMSLAPTLRYAGGTRGWVGDSPQILLDTTRLNGLGWTPKRSLEESVLDTLRYLQASPFMNRTAADPR